MPTRVRDDVERHDVATSPNDFVDEGHQILVNNIQVSHPMHIDRSYRLIDAHHPNGVSARLKHQPGAGKMTATFEKN